MFLEDVAQMARKSGRGREVRFRDFTMSQMKRNLRLAAQPSVGHIRLNGAVAEWLKAAVC
jgi:hypothetical protein